MSVRIGTGYDVHRFEAGRKLVLGGVEIPCEYGLLGHSDADVLCHAITDALLGAVCLPDIGRRFPDTDPAFEGADSIMLLKDAWNEISGMGYHIVNIDSTVIAEKPKMKPYIDEMRRTIADALGTGMENVNVKATTEEGLGIGGMGIGAEAVVLIEK